MKRELFALTILFVLFVVFPSSLFAYQAWLTNSSDARVITLTANAPSNGGWVPDTIRINVGERVRLRIAAPDVVHGFEIPALGIQVDEILPGHVVEVEFVASRAGKFPFACTRWCSVDHWRMRGNILVIDPKNPNPAQPTFAPPLYQQLKIDIDALHPAQNVPSQRPSAARGASPAGLIVIAHDLRTQSPSDVFAQLRATESLKAYSDRQLWDALAFAWKQSAGEESIAKGEKLFARDCAACHGEAGKGNGPAGRDLPGLAAMQSDTHAMQVVKRGPADFTNATEMLGASDVLLQGKIVRGGMGTGMPEWRTLYTDEEMWQVISFIRSFTFDYRSTK
ncbi:MAG: cytochrome c oxidase subunit II [Chloroflexi bacterium]|nr:cytochrome c oxidase subunit II [Chloroflexota bacterium]